MSRTWLSRFTYRRAIIDLLVLALAIAVGLAVWQGLGWSRYVRFAAESRRAALERSGACEVRTVRFTFHGAVHRVDVRTDRAELDAARHVDTLGIFGGTRALRESLLRELVRSQVRSSTVVSFAEGLRAVRDAEGLDPDEYVELITAAVQSIPYGVVDSEIDLPAEVVSNQRGVCTEKSFLLAAILAHEGYDAGVWVFDSQRHVTAAVRGSGSGLFDTGYSVIETTARAYVGEVPSECRGRGPISYVPQLVTVSGGGERYAADVQTGVILAALDRANASSLQLAKYREFAAQAEDADAAEYARSAERQAAATRLADWIADGVENRGRTYRLLTQSGAR